jgi:hypothetical protein
MSAKIIPFKPKAKVKASVPAPLEPTMEQRTQHLQTRAIASLEDALKLLGARTPQKP